MDAMARAGAKQNFIGPEPAIPVAFAMVSSNISSWIHNIHIELWESDNSCKHAHETITNILKNKIKLHIVNQDKSDLRLLAHLLSGHNYLSYHQFKLKNVKSELCMNCKMSSETTEHFLGFCPKYAATRKRTIGIFYAHFNRIFSVAPIKNIINYMRLAYNFPKGYYQSRPPNV